MRTDDATAFQAIDRAMSRLMRGPDGLKVREKVEQVTGIDLDRSSYHVLTRISEHEPVSLSDLAAHLWVDLSAVSRRTKVLEELGYVTRVAPPEDKRTSLLSLSPTGRDAIDKLRAARAKLFTRLLEQWDDDDIKQLATLMERFADDITASVEHGQ